MARSRDDGTLPITETTSLLSVDQPVTEQTIGHFEQRIVLLIFTIFFMLEFSAGLMEPGYTAALEQRLCQDAYPSLVPFSADDQDCKSPLIQGKLASLSGWQYTMACIPSLFATVPYGMLSDTWGRSRVLTLAFLGIILATGFQLSVVYLPVIPVEITLLASLFQMIGGGTGVVSAMVYTSLTDIVPIASRATVFMQLVSLNIVSEIASSALAGLILSRSIPALLFISFGLMLLVALLSLFLPDTLGLVKDRKSPCVEDEYTDTITDTATANQSPSLVHETFRKARDTLKSSCKFMYSHGKLTALMVAFVFAILPKLVQGLLLQYTTKRYGWSWSKASFLITVRSIVSLISLMVVLPGVNYLLVTKLKLGATHKDVWIARGTGLAGVIGALMIAFAETSDILIIGLVIIALNGGMAGTIRSLLSMQVEPHHMGTLNSLVGVVELLGVMIFAPAFYGSLRKGLELGGGWIGLPFMSAAFMLSISTGIVFFCSVR